MGDNSPRTDTSTDMDGDAKVGCFLISLEIMWCNFFVSSIAEVCGCYVDNSTQCLIIE